MSCNCDARDRDLMLLGALAEIRQIIKTESRKIGEILMTVNERLANLVTAVQETNSQTAKVRGEIVAATDALTTQVSALSEQVRNGTVDESVVTALESAINDLRGSVQGLDELHVDTPPVDLPPAEQPGTTDPAPVDQPPAIPSDGTGPAVSDGFNV